MGRMVESHTSRNCSCANIVTVLTSEAAVERNGCSYLQFLIFIFEDLPMHGSDTGAVVFA